MLLVPRIAGRASRFVLALAFVGSCLVSFTARAQESADEVSRLRKDGERAINEARLVDAFEILEKVVAISGELWDACNLGRTSYRLRKMPAAVEYLSQCDRLGEKEEPSKLSPRDQRLLAEARGELALARQRVGRLWILVDQPDAEVLVDDKNVGTSPMLREIVLDPGVHHVKATLGTKSGEARVDVPVGQMRKVELHLAAPLPLPEPKATSPEIAKPKAALVPSPGAPQLVRQEQAWPAILFGTAGGVLLTGAGITTGAYVAKQNALKDIEEHRYTANAWGCPGAALQCNSLERARESAETADMVMKVSLSMTGILTSGLLVAGFLGKVTAPVTIQPVPTVGGITFRGKF